MNNITQRNQTTTANTNTIILYASVNVLLVNKTFLNNIYNNAFMLFHVQYIHICVSEKLLLYREFIKTCSQHQRDTLTPLKITKYCKTQTEESEATQIFISCWSRRPRVGVWPAVAVICPSPVCYLSAPPSPRLHSLCFKSCSTGEQTWSQTGGLVSHPHIRSQARGNTVASYELAE